MAAEAVKCSEGWAVTVHDEGILDAQLTLTRYAGVLAEPAAACAYAALERDRDNLVSRLGKDAEAVVLITGTGFKDMKAFDGRAAIPEDFMPLPISTCAAIPKSPLKSLAARQKMAASTV